MLKADTRWSSRASVRPHARHTQWRAPDDEGTWISPLGGAHASAGAPRRGEAGARPGWALHTSRLFSLLCFHAPGYVPCWVLR